MTERVIEDPIAEDPLACAQLEAPTIVPLPTAATCRELPNSERAECSARVRERARLPRALGAAQSARDRRDWPLAVSTLTEAYDTSLEPDVLAELAWTRFLAWSALRHPRWSPAGPARSW